MNVTAKDGYFDDQRIIICSSAIAKGRECYFSFSFSF